MVEELLANNKDLWQDFLHHPFIKELGSGVLPKEKFRFYTIQDYLYLLEYSKLFGLAVVKSPDEASMKVFATCLNEILNKEMAIHFDYLKYFKIEPLQISKSYKPHLSNLSYTSYMLKVASCGGIGELVIALLSCALSYEHIAKYLLKHYGCKDEFYGPWIKAYASDEYNQLNSWLINLANKLCKNASLEERAVYNDIFRNCCYFEYKFWDMSYENHTACEQLSSK